MEPHVINQETQQLYELMRECAPGEIVAYAEMSECIKRDVMTCRHFIASARRQLKRIDGIVFAPVKNEGFIRLRDSEIVHRDAFHTKKIRRAAKRGAEELACVNDFATLTNEDMLRHQSAMSAFGAISQALSPSGLKKLRGAVQVANNQLPSPSVLDAWK